MATPRTLYLAEPAAAYQLRPPLVVDCSVVAATVFDEAWRDQALRIVSGRSLHAPYLLDHEIGNVARKKQLQGADAEATESALSDYADQKITLHRTDVPEQVALSSRYGLSAYDAAYLWLAAELKAPLATFDRRLAEVAQAHLQGL